MFNEVNHVGGKRNFWEIRLRTEMITKSFFIVIFPSFNPIKHNS